MIGRAFEHHFGSGGGNLNDPIFKSSNAGVGVLLKFRVDQRIIDTWEHMSPTN